MTGTAFTPWEDRAALDVCLNLRPADAREVFATRHDDNGYNLFVDLKNAQGAALISEIVWRGGKLGRPVAILGIFGRTPGVATAIMLATDELTAAEGRAAVRRVRRSYTPRLIAHGVHRVDCQSHEAHSDAHRFLAATGARRGDVRPAVGREREGFIEFYWLHPSPSERT